MKAPPQDLRSDDGFTMVEVLVAAVLLIIGAFATLSLLDNGTQATALSKQRDVANALTQEIVERAQGGRYIAPAAATSAGVNDMTDVTPASATPGPADRMRAALDPDSDSQSTAVTPATVTSGTTPNLAAQSWSLVRKNTRYTVSYRACTISDTYGQVNIQGPFDCNRGSSVVNPPTPPTSGNCTLGAIPASQVNPADPGTLTVKLQLLGITGLSVCVGALSQNLSSALCTLLGTSPTLTSLTSTLLGTSGVLTSLLGALGSGATLGTCTASQLDQPLTGARGAIATSTRLTVTVSWTDLKQKAQQLTQSVVVRRPTT